MELSTTNPVNCRVRVSSQGLPIEANRSHVGSIGRLIGAPVWMENHRGRLGNPGYLGENQNNTINTMETN